MATTRIDRPGRPWATALATILLALSATAPSEAAAPAGVEELNAIVAVVNDDVIVNSELQRGVAAIIPELRARGTPVPDDKILRKQVLERIISKRLQAQRAKQLGIKVDDAALTQTITSIASRNKLTLEELRATLESGGMRFEDFREDTRTQMIDAQLQRQEVLNTITVTEPEIDRFLEKESGRLVERSEVRLQHILIAFPEGASPEQVQKAQAKAAGLVRQLRAGADFAKLAIANSDGQQALEGGDLGWFKIAEVPTLVAEPARTLAKGEVSDPLRSQGGFHIVKVSDIKGTESEAVTQTHARHILVRTSEVLADDDAKTRLAQLRLRILGGDDFATLARSHSDDTGSALKGGDLGWVNPGDTVPDFEQAMSTLAPNEISQPFKTSFGWHIVQVLERRQADTTAEVLRQKAREAIRQRKAREATELWLRRLRDEAYVEIRLDKTAD
jgi:peptidyl-prolyl cis-trans isomerase SurA